jgi:hypothetical protein
MKGVIVMADSLLLECGCAYEDFGLIRDRGGSLCVPGSGTKCTEVAASKNKRAECMYPIAAGTAGNLIGIG